MQCFKGCDEFDGGSMRVELLQLLCIRHVFDACHGRLLLSVDLCNESLATRWRCKAADRVEQYGTLFRICRLQSEHIRFELPLQSLQPSLRCCS